MSVEQVTEAEKNFAVVPTELWFYERGTTIATLAKWYRVSNKKMRERLQSFGVDTTARRRSGRPRADFCPKEHDQSIHRRGRPGRTYCGACDKERKQGAGGSTTKERTDAS